MTVSHAEEKTPPERSREHTPVRLQARPAADPAYPELPNSRYQDSEQNTRELRSVAAQSLAGLLVFLVAESAAVAVFAELGECFRRLFGRESVGLLG
jgi:hypothetical protein